MDEMKRQNINTELRNYMAWEHDKNTVAVLIDGKTIMVSKESFHKNFRIERLGKREMYTVTMEIMKPMTDRPVIEQTELELGLETQVRINMHNLMEEHRRETQRSIINPLFEQHYNGARPDIDPPGFRGGKIYGRD